MKSNIFTILGALTGLVSSIAFGQQGNPAPHPEAEKAMEKIVLKKDFGEKLRFRSREVVTMLKNDRVPGLNGLMFMRWTGADSETGVLASVQWFEKRDGLLKFYAQTTKNDDHILVEFDGVSLWKIGEAGYSWTDGEHFLVSLAGSPRPPEAMIKDWLSLIGSKVAEIEKDVKRNPTPVEKPIE